MKRSLLFSPAAALLLALTAYAQTTSPPGSVPQPNINPTSGPTPVTPGASPVPGVAAATAGAQVTSPAGVQLQGRIVRVDRGQFVIEGTDRKTYTLYTNPQSTFRRNDQVIPYTSVAVGSNVVAYYTPQGERYFVSAVNVLPAPAIAPPVTVAPPIIAPAPQPVPAPAPAPTQVVVVPVVPATTYYEGEIVRVVAPDQVVLRTATAQEVVVFVQPQTTFEIGTRRAALADLRPGLPVRVSYDLRDQRPYARTFVSIRTK